MKYISTRGKAPELGFEDVVTTGLASDGGLYVPKEIPTFSKQEIASWKNLSYQELAFKVMYPFVKKDFSEGELKTLIEKSYKTFRHDDVAPLAKISENEYILELFHGPTLAFKDFALQFLGNLLDHILDKKKQDVVIIGATSGDTGSAAIEGCKNCKHINLFMLHPHGRVSDVQRKQMTTILSPNIHNLAIDGNFDDCQNMVKEMFSNRNFINKPITAVNSINWARIMAQIVYYFSAALKLGAPEKPISFSVPTGNFGDIFAGYMAYKMGLPIDKLIVATNKNDILHRFFQNNDYSASEVHPSLSPSMDIQISSNFERLLFDLYGQDGEKITELMNNFKNNGKFTVEDEILTNAREKFDSCATNDEEIKEIIKLLHHDLNYIADPHTATAINAAKKCNFEGDIVILSTAHPAKFPDAVKSAAGINPELPDHLSDLFEREEKVVRLPKDIEKIKDFIAKNA